MLFDGVVLQKGRQRPLRLRAAVLPQGASESVPGAGEADLIGVRVLNDQPVERFRVAHHNPEADRAAVVLNEEPVVIEAPVLQERLDDFGEPVEGVGEGCRIGHVAVAESRIVGRNHVEASGQRRDQVAVLMGGCGKPVQQDQFRAAGIAGLTVRDVESVHLSGPVVSGNDSGGDGGHRCHLGFS